MPLHNWFEINRTGNLTYLRKKPKAKEEYNAYLQGIWDRMYDQIIEEFGLSDEFKQMLKLRQRRIRHLSNYVIFEDSSELTEAELIEIELNELVGEVGDVSDYDSIIMMERVMGIKINVREFTVYEYHSYLVNLSKNGKEGNK